MSTKPFDPVQHDNTEVLAPESSSAVQRIESAQIDMQVATAKKYPRSMEKFYKTALAMATMNQEIASGCFYKLKRRDKEGRDTFIEGPSVRLLEIAASAYMNLSYGARIVGEEDGFIVSQGVAWDLESNVRSTLEVRRRITTKDGRRFGDDMIGVTANAACSIAKRNALNGIVPRVYINELMNAAKDIAVGKNKPLGERVQKCLEQFSKIGVSKEQILVFLEKTEVSLIDYEDIENLIGVFTGIREGEFKVEEQFPSAPKSTAPNFVGKPAPKSSATAAEKKTEAKVETVTQPPVGETTTDVPAGESTTAPTIGVDPNLPPMQQLQILMKNGNVNEDQVLAHFKGMKAVQIKADVVELPALSDAKLKLLIGLFNDELPQIQAITI